MPQEPTARCKDHNADSEWIHRFPPVDSNPRKPTGGVLSLLWLSLIPWEIVSSEVQLGNFQVSILWCPFQFLASRHE